MSAPAFHLRTEHDRARVIAHITSLNLETPAKITVSDADRSVEQNAMLHKLLSDIAKQVDHAGKKWNVLIWKRLCTAAWMREAGENAQLIPALDGNGFDVIYERTSQLGVKQCASLIEWVQAFGAEHQVKWSARDSWGGRY